MSPLPASIHIEQVQAGYEASQKCRAVRDSLDLSMCLNEIESQHKAENVAGSNFSLGFSLGTFTLMDGIAVAIERMGLSPSTNLQAKAASDTTLVAAIGLERQGRAAGIDDGSIRTVIARVANTPPERWDYWRAKPMPDWLAKQLPK